MLHQHGLRATSGDTVATHVWARAEKRHRLYASVVALLRGRKMAVELSSPGRPDQFIKAKTGRTACRFSKMVCSAPTMPVQPQHWSLRWQVLAGCLLLSLWAQLLWMWLCQPKASLR